jgi:hypothetical protein
MTTFNTSNPIGSTDARDRLDNTENMDYLENSTTKLTHPDRLGTVRKTRHGMEVEHDAQILNMGFTRVGTFAAGVTLTNPRQTLIWDIADGGDGQEYGWSGAFPKVVPATSAPTSTGGISVGAWISRFDPELRIQVREALRRSYAGAGYNLVAGSFEAGGTLVNANDALLHEASGKAFSGNAGVIAAGTNPTSGGFVDVSGVVENKATVYVRAFGAKSDAYISKPSTIAGVMGWGAIRNPSATDSRAAIENAINYASSLGGATIVFDGDFYVNSYSADTALASAHNQILPVKSNITYQGVNNAHIVVGSFFDDKSFVLFSGFNTPSTADLTKIFNVAFKGLSFDFHGESSRMRTSYKRRLGLDLGWAFNTEVSWCTFENGDLSNAIGIAAGKREGDTCTIDNCNFFNLVQENPVNIDFTANYIGARNSMVTNCRYSNASTQGARIACAVEFHSSLCKFSDSTISGGYTRGFWVTSHIAESTYVHDCGADNITSLTTNAFCWLWAEAGCVIEGVAVRNCNIKCHHIVGDSYLSNACQGLVCSSGNGITGAVHSFHATNNTVVIKYTESAGDGSWNLKRDAAVFMASPYDYDNLNISFNTFINTMSGVTLRTPEHAINNVILANNEFLIYDDKVLVADQTLIELNCTSMLNVMVHSNTFNVIGAQSVAMNELAIINTGGMTDCYIETNSRIVGHRPIRGDIYQQSAMFNNLVRSTVKFNKYNATLSIPDIPASSFGVAGIGISNDFITDGNCHFEFIPNTYTKTEYVSSFSGNRAGSGVLGCAVYNNSPATVPGSTISGVTAITIVRP